MCVKGMVRVPLPTGRKEVSTQKRQKAESGGDSWLFPWVQVGCAVLCGGGVMWRCVCVRGWLRSFVVVNSAHGFVCSAQLFESCSNLSPGCARQGPGRTRAALPGMQTCLWGRTRDWQERFFPSPLLSEVPLGVKGEAGRAREPPVSWQVPLCSLDRGNRCCESMLVLTGHFPHSPVSFA